LAVKAAIIPSFFETTEKPRQLLVTTSEAMKSDVIAHARISIGILS
jgi:hypothetical protein